MVRHVESADAVVMDHNALGGNTVLLFCLVGFSMLLEVPLPIHLLVR